VQGLEEFGHRQAESYRDGIKQTFTKLAEFPGMGRSRPDVGPTARTWPFKAHVILYREDEEGGVLILRIRSAREDWLNDPLGGRNDT